MCFSLLLLMLVVIEGCLCIAATVNGNDRLNGLRQERDELQRRLGLVRTRLQELNASLQPVLRSAGQGTGLRNVEERPQVPRLRMNADGTITEYR